jgi:hypothetical protein
MFTAYSVGHRLVIHLEKAETDISFFKMAAKEGKNIDNHSHNPVFNICHLPDPPYFSLATTISLIATTISLISH